MKPDPIDRLGARLFEAARSEALPRGAEARALAAARPVIRESTRASAHFPWRRTWIAAAACLAIAASVALLLRPKQDSLGINAEPSSVAHTRPKQPAVPLAEAPSNSAPVVPVVPSLAVAHKPAPSVGPSALQSQPVSLSDELSALKIASNALSAGDPQAALAALERYDRVLKGQKLRAEATLLRIESLSRAGRAADASALARRFVEQNPGSTLVDRARSFVHE
ncbi:MAG TPA: hypothetical protein VGC79_31530 [Polyangiaceae bacterium]